MFDLDTEERQYLLELLQSAHTTLLHEIHHSRTRRFEDALRHKVAINERLSEKVAVEGAERPDPVVSVG